jgi:hypothetical protein
MGGDDLGSEDEFAQPQSVHESDDESDDLEDNNLAVESKRKASDSDNQAQPLKKKKVSSDQVIDSISKLSAQQQAKFLSSAIAEYMAKTEDKSPSPSLEASFFRKSDKETLLQRVTDIVAQNKIKKWKHEQSPCVVSHVIIRFRSSVEHSFLSR